jgi:PAS domain S-box-containing protein
MKKRDDRPADASGLRRKAEKIARKKAALSSENLETLSPEETGRILYELRVHQVELEMQNEELRRTQVELQASRERYFDLYDLAPVGYLTLSDKGLILEANLTFARLLGVAKGLLANQPLTRFILREDQDIWYRFHKQSFETETVQACELRIRGVKDHPFWVQIQITEDWDAEGAPLLRVTLSDISAGKKAEEKQQAREERYRSFIEVTGQLAWTTNKDGAVVEDIPVWRKFTCQNE